jgi:hypothetical protein
MLDKVVSPIACVSMNHQNQFEQMANRAMLATSRRPAACGGRRWPSVRATEEAGEEVVEG